MTVKGDINASNLDVWIDGQNTNTSTKVSVEGNFTETEDSKVGVQYNGILEVKGGLTVNISNEGGFYIANSKNVPVSLKVGKDFTFSNHITKNNKFDPNDLFFDASIGTAAAEIGEILFFKVLMMHRQLISKLPIVRQRCESSQYSGHWFR